MHTRCLITTVRHNDRFRIHLNSWNSWQARQQSWCFFNLLRKEKWRLTANTSKLRKQSTKVKEIIILLLLVVSVRLLIIIKNNNDATESAQFKSMFYWRNLAQTYISSNKQWSWETNRKSFSPKKLYHDFIQIASVICKSPLAWKAVWIKVTTCSHFVSTNEPFTKSPRKASEQILSKQVKNKQSAWEPVSWPG